MLKQNTAAVSRGSKVQLTGDRAFSKRRDGGAPSGPGSGAQAASARRTRWRGSAAEVRRLQSPRPPPGTRGQPTPRHHARRCPRSPGGPAAPGGETYAKCRPRRGAAPLSGETPFRESTCTHVLQLIPRQHAVSPNTKSGRGSQAGKAASGLHHQGQRCGGRRPNRTLPARANSRSPKPQSRVVGKPLPHPPPPSRIRPRRVRRAQRGMKSVRRQRSTDLRHPRLKVNFLCEKKEKRRTK